MANRTKQDHGVSEAGPAEAGAIPGPATGVLAGDLGVDAPVEARGYWIGVTSISPRYHFIVGGQCFPMVTHAVYDSPDELRTRRDLRRGAIAFLLPEQVELVQRQARELVVRMVGTGARAKRVVVNAAAVTRDKTGQMVKAYQRYPLDHPVACYLFMVPLEERVRYATHDGKYSEPDAMEPLPLKVLERLNAKPTAGEDREESIEDVLERRLAEAQAASGYAGM